MKKTAYLLIITLAFLTTINAQKMGKQRIQALKISYITTAINLNTSEAEKFWPVYNTYSDKIQELKTKLGNENFRRVKNTGNIDALTDKEAEEILANRINYEEEILKNKIALTKELKKIISAKKIIKLQKAERDFNRRLLQEFGKRRGMNRQ